MNRTVKKSLLGIGCAVVALAVALYTQPETAAAPRFDLKPNAHWVLDSEGVSSRKITDRAGVLHGTILGEPKLNKDAACLELSNPNDGVSIRAAVTPDADFLPKDAFSIVAWVRVDEPAEWGAFLGCFQDNGPKEKGFVVGFNKANFYFGLATEGGESGEGKITYLNGTTKYESRRWYHVAAVYDGKRMQLYVNGKLDGESKEQSGPVSYAAKAPLVIGRYRDDDEDYPMVGGIREILWCHRAVTAEQLVAHFQADAKLASAPPAAAGPKFVVEPYLQNATRTAMTVMCETDTPTTCELEYGDTYPPKLTAKSAKADMMHEIPLANLVPKTKYFYRMRCTDADGKTVDSRPLTFMTGVDADDAWSFTVIGDTQRNPRVTGKVAKLMWERRPHFVLHCGDVVDDGASKAQWTGDLFKPCSELFGRVPVFPCIGNHEKNHPHYYKYFSLPKPEYYYSYQYGNAAFFSLDTNGLRTADLQPGGVQYEWLDKALAASDAKWKICYHHHPVFSSDSDDYGNTWKGKSTDGDVRLKSLQALYEKHNVDVVFNGHIHLYERSWPIRGGKVDQKNGVVHITSGGGGGGLEDFGPTPTFFKAECRSDYHFCYVTVHRGTFHLKAFDQEGRLFDAMTLKKE